MNCVLYKVYIHSGVHRAGEKVQYSVMPPGGSYRGLLTYSTHPWVLEDPEGTVYALYVGAFPAAVATERLLCTAAALVSQQYTRVSGACCAATILHPYTHY